MKYLLYALLLFITGCTGSDKEYHEFEGSWKKIKPVTFMEGYYYDIKFQNDSFYYKRKWYTDVISVPDTCLGLGSWTEYAAGKFYTANKKLYFDGYWTDSAYSTKIERSCFNTGKFEIRYYYKFIGPDTLILNKNEYRFSDFIRYPKYYDKLTFIRK